MLAQVNVKCRYCGQSAGETNGRCNNCGAYALVEMSEHPLVEIPYYKQQWCIDALQAIKTEGERSGYLVEEHGRARLILWESKTITKKNWLGHEIKKRVDHYWRLEAAITDSKTVHLYYNFHRYRLSDPDDFDKAKPLAENIMKATGMNVVMADQSYC